VVVRHDEEMLEVLLQKLDQGLTIEEALADYSGPVEDLRPRLQAALQARSLKTSLPIPADIQHRARIRFLVQAAQYRRSARHKRFFSVQWAYALALVVAFLAVALAGTGLASAQALPGDGLYPIKLAVEQARIRLTTDSGSRLSLEENIDQRRVDEVVQLLGKNRVQAVSFAGFLTQGGPTGWQIAGIPVVLTEQISSLIASLEGMYVEVEGKTSSQSQQVEVTDAQLRLFHLEGKIETFQPNARGVWKVGGVQVEVDPATALSGEPAIGRTASITAIRVKGDRLLALFIRIGELPGSLVPSAITPLPPGSSGKVATAMQQTSTPLPSLTPTMFPSVTANPQRDMETTLQPPNAEEAPLQPEPPESQDPPSSEDSPKDND